MNESNQGEQAAGFTVAMLLAGWILLFPGKIGGWMSRVGFERWVQGSFGGFALMFMGLVLVSGTMVGLILLLVVLVTDISSLDNIIELVHRWVWTWPALTSVFLVAMVRAHKKELQEGTSVSEIGL